MSPPLQAKLLRVTQEGRFHRVGSNTELQTNARILAATNKILEEQVKAGRFREDLYYRLNVVELNIPSLRERPEDILPLANAFMAEFTHGKARFASSVADCLTRYAWPGNVRELRNAMERAALLSLGELILPEHLPAKVRAVAETAPAIEPLDAERLAGDRAPSHLPGVAQARLQPHGDSQSAGHQPPRPDLQAATLPGRGLRRRSGLAGGPQLSPARPIKVFSSGSRSLHWRSGDCDAPNRHGGSTEGPRWM